MTNDPVPMRGKTTETVTEIEVYLTHDAKLNNLKVRLPASLAGQRFQYFVEKDLGRLRLVPQDGDTAYKPYLSPKHQRTCCLTINRHLAGLSKASLRKFSKLLITAYAYHSQEAGGMYLIMVPLDGLNLQEDTTQPKTMSEIRKLCGKKSGKARRLKAGHKVKAPKIKKQPRPKVTRDIETQDTGPGSRARDQGPLAGVATAVLVLVGPATRLYHLKDLLGSIEGVQATLTEVEGPI